MLEAYWLKISNVNGLFLIPRFIILIPGDIPSYRLYVTSGLMYMFLFFGLSKSPINLNLNGLVDLDLYIQLLFWLISGILTLGFTAT